MPRVGHPGKWGTAGLRCMLAKGALRLHLRSSVFEHASEAPAATLGMM